MLWLLFDCSLIALWWLSVCSLSADLFLTDCLKIWARMMTIDFSRQVWTEQTNERTEISISWAPVGAKNHRTILRLYLSSRKRSAWGLRLSRTMLGNSRANLEILLLCTLYQSDIWLFYLLAEIFVASDSFWVRLGAIVLRASLYKMLSQAATALRRLRMFNSFQFLRKSNLTWQQRRRRILWLERRRQNSARTAAAAFLHYWSWNFKNKINI